MQWSKLTELEVPTIGPHTSNETLTSCGSPYSLLSVDRMILLAQNVLPLQVGWLRILFSTVLFKALSRIWQWKFIMGCCIRSGAGSKICTCQRVWSWGNSSASKSSDSVVQIKITECSWNLFPQFLVTVVLKTMNAFCCRTFSCAFGVLFVINQVITFVVIAEENFGSKWWCQVKKFLSWKAVPNAWLYTSCNRGSRLCSRAEHVWSSPGWETIIGCDFFLRTLELFSKWTWLLVWRVCLHTRPSRFRKFLVHAWGSVEVWTKRILCRIIEGRTHFGMPRGAKISFALKELK